MTNIRNEIRIKVLPAAIRALNSIGLGVIPRKVSSVVSPIASRLIGDYQAGVSIKYAQFPNSHVIKEHAEIRQKIESVKYNTVPRRPKDSANHYAEIYDLAGEPCGVAHLRHAHELGLRHKTSNIILVLPDGNVIMQLRARDKHPFPNKWTISAGGNIDLKEGDLSPENPKETIRRELYEELGIDIHNDIDRLIPLVEGDKPLPNFAKIWEYSLYHMKATFVQFDKKAIFIGTEGITGSLPSDIRKEIFAGIRLMAHENPYLKQYPGLELTTWNVELCHYYALLISEAERKMISFADQEVANVRTVSLEEMVKAGRDLNMATDSLFSLFYGKSEFANKLQALCEKAKNPNASS